jgi:hypothetical protein
MVRLAHLLCCLALVAPGAALASGDDPGTLAAALSSQWHLADDAVLVVDAGSKRPLLCVAAVRETGDSLVSDKAADLTCRGKVAKWIGDGHWVRVTGLTQRWSGNPGNMLIVLFAFADVGGPSDQEVARLLNLAISKGTDRAASQVEVRRGLIGDHP